MASKMRLAVAISYLMVLISLTAGCGTTKKPDAADDTTSSIVEDDNLIEGMTPMWSPESSAEDALPSGDYDTNQMLEQLRAALEKHPHQANWRAGSNFNWATFTVDFGPQFPSDPDTAFEQVWKEWTTPECDLTDPTGADSLQGIIRRTLEEAIQKEQSENEIIFRGFKFYVIAHQASRRNSDNSCELQFLNAKAAIEFGE